MSRSPPRDPGSARDSTFLCALTLSAPPQRRASRLLRSGRAQSQVEAEMASQLMALRFPADESLQAATQCSSLYAAVSFLHQECELCAGRCSAKEVRGGTGGVDGRYLDRVGAFL